MSNKEAFLIGFLARCADEALTPAETAERVKHAAISKDAVGWSTVKDIATTPLSAAKAMLGLGGAASTLGLKALMLPAAAGGAVGYGLSQLQDDNFSVEDAQADEELAEWYRAIDALRRAHPPAV